MDQVKTDAKSESMEIGEVEPGEAGGRPTGRVYGYARVSSTEQAKEGRTSLDNQRHKIRLAGAGRGVEDFEVFSDEGISGNVKFRERPEGGRLFAELKRGDTLIAAKLDRMFRNLGDAAATAEDFRRRGIDLILLDLSTDSITGGGLIARAMFHVVALFADFERERIRERSEEAKAALRREGYFTGGRPRFGFRVEQVGPHRQREVPDEDQQAAVRAALLAWDQEKPMREILRLLFAGGHRNTKGNSFRSEDIYRWVRYRDLREPNRANVSARTKALQAARKARGEKLGNPRMGEISAQGLAEILANVGRRAVEVKPYIEGAIAGGAGTFRQVANILNLKNVPTARGGRWHASTVLNSMVAVGLKFPSKTARKAQGLPRAVARRGLPAASMAALDAEARDAQQRLAKPRLGKAQRAIPQILKLHAEGFAPGGIARTLDLHEGTVGEILRATGRRTRRTSSTRAIEQRTARILEARLRGLNARQIADELGLAENIVHVTCSHAAAVDPQYALGRKHLTPDELDRIAELRRQGTPVPEIAAKLKRSKRTVYRAVADSEPGFE
jgi:DNA invertase Pin-like site-specific DNA recombinase/DNA-binding NarL/FixJ family response regulator